jgi:hypothetical protein
VPKVALTKQNFLNGLTHKLCGVQTANQEMDVMQGSPYVPPRLSSFIMGDCRHGRMHAKGRCYGSYLPVC